MDTVTSTVTKDNLFAGTYPVVKGYVTVAQSQTIVRGTVIGIVTTGGQAVELDTASSDGSQNFYAIALDPVTTGVGETASLAVALSGEFHSQGLTLGGSTTVADIWNDARDKNCYIKTTYSTENMGA